MAYLDVSFFSEALNRQVACAVYLPTDQGPYIELPAAEQAPLKTLYLLHGMTGSLADWRGAPGLAQIARDYNVAIVMPSGENSFYSDSAVIGRAFGTFVGRELVAFTRRTFPLSRRREDTFIGGLSMGGFGALVNGLRNPDTFGYITAFSAALIKRLILRADDEPGLDYFTRTQYQAMFGLERIEDFEGCDSDYEALARRLAAIAGPRPRIYMDCGTEDTSLYRANTAFKDLLLSLGYEVTWDSRPGLHDWAFWGESLQRAMEFLPVERLRYAQDSPRAAAARRMNEAMVRKMA